ncbi:CDI toxin immunity protein [Streptomyces sp. NPDC054784]
MFDNSMYGTFVVRLDDLVDSLSQSEREEAVLLTGDENSTYMVHSLQKFPLTTRHGIDWECCDFLEQQWVGTEVEAASALADSVTRLVNPESLVVMLWGNLAVPALALCARSVARHADEVVAASDDMWLFVDDEKLIFEYIHDGRFTVSKVPA